MADVALVGAAHIHTPGFVKKMADREDVHVKYVWDHDAERAKKNAEQLDAEGVDLDRIWTDDRITAAVICSETNRHQELATRAAQAGKHLFVEKPLGMGAADSWPMCEAIESAGVIFQTGYFQRGAPIARFLKQQIDAGVFGKLHRAHHSNCHNGTIGRWFDTDWRWMADPKIAGVGAFGDLGTHSLDILLWWLGEVDQVTADIKTVLGHYGDCDETGSGLLKFKNGATATLVAGWANHANPMAMEVVGTEGHAAVVDRKLYFNCKNVDGADGKQPWTDLPEKMPHAFDLFLDAINGKEGLPLIPVRHAAYCGSVMEAMYEGATRRAWVEPK